MLTNREPACIQKPSSLSSTSRPSSATARSRVACRFRGEATNSSERAASTISASPTLTTASPSRRRETPQERMAMVSPKCERIASPMVVDVRTRNGSRSSARRGSTISS